MKEIIPAILTDNPAELNNFLNNLKGLTGWVHIDIMDGHFVPNKSIKVTDLGATINDFNFEIHLMVDKPDKYFSDCATVDAKRVIFHAEAADNIDTTLKAMDAFAYERGLALNPETSISSIRKYLNLINEVLLMSVIPGKQSQLFVGSALNKARELKKLMPSMTVGMDGGIKFANINQVVATGVDRCVIGSAIVKSDNYKNTINKFYNEINFPPEDV
ncbi:ribulose-phosphate 3-epimerase [Patescibacteria group bacterium]